MIRLTCCGAVLTAAIGWAAVVHVAGQTAAAPAGLISLVTG